MNFVVYRKFLSLLDVTKNKSETAKDQNFQLARKFKGSNNF